MGNFSLSGGVEVTGFISPTNPLDEYPVIDPLYGIDGFRNVNLLSDLNNIPELRRRAGMVVGVSGGTDYYKLLPSPWNYTISDWGLFQTGGGSTVFTGGTVSGDTIFTQGLSANTFSATTYLGLPLDVYVTGGTYFNGTTTFINNTGGTFNVVGYYTGNTDNNQYVTGFTYQDNTFTISDNSGSTFNAIINTVTGLTVNGVLSATTYQNLPLDVYVTGLTFNTSNYDLTIGRNDGVSFTDSLSILSSDLTVTGGTYNSNSGVATFTNNTGGTFDVSGFITGFTDIYTTGITYSNNEITISDTANNTYSTFIDNFTGLTINGVLSATTIGTSGDCVDDIYVSNIHSCSPLNINPIDEGNVYFGSTSGVTIDLTNNRVGIGTSTPTEKLDVVGKTKTTNLQITSGATAGYVLTAVDSSGNTKWEALGSTSNELDPVLTITGTTASTVNIGDRFLISGGTGIWSGRTNQIAEYTGVTPTDYSYYIPVIDDVVFVTDTLTTYRFDGTNWISWRGTAILQNGNSLTTSVNIGTNNNQNLNLRTSGQTRVTISGSTGNVGIGTTTPTAKLEIKAAGTNAATYSLKVKDFSNAVDLLSLDDTGIFRLNHPTFTGTFSIRMTANNTVVFDNSGIGNFIRFGPTNIINTLGQQIQSFDRGASFGSSLSNPVQVPYAIQIANLPSQSTGTTSNVDALRINPSITTTATYTGTYRGIYYNPTVSITTGTTHLAIETVRGDVLFGTTSGNVGIGTTTPSEKLDVSGKTKTINLQVTSGATTGYVLTSDSSGNATWQQTSTFTGGTVNGITATTISATTYQNLPVTADTFTTGFTYSNNTFTIERNQGLSNLTATINSVTGLTVNGNLTVTGNTSLQDLTATTVSATTYQNLPTDIRVTGGTYSNGTTTFTNNTGGTFNVTGFTTAPNLSKILFVDPNGNDSTGTKGNMNLPYLTLEAAKSASTTGDTIYVFPGTYTVTTTDTEGLAKDGVGYYFSPKTTINKSTLGPIFYANGFVNGFNVYGYGNFNKTGLNGAIFSSNNISVYGSVLTASVNVVGAGYTAGIKTTTGGSGIGLVINVTAVGGGGTISTFTISNVGADYKVGDIIDVVQVGGSGGKIRIDSVVNNPDKDADVSFEANDLFASNAADPDPSPSTRTGVFYIVNTARCNIKFNNLYISTTRLGFSINTSNVNVNMNSIVSVGGSLFVGPNGSLGGIGSSTLSVFGNLISAVGVNAQAFAMSSGGVGFINVQTINTPNTNAYSFGGNAATATFNVQTMGRIFGQAASTIYLNGYTSTIDGVLNLYGGVVGRINGIGGGTIQTAYGGLWTGNEAPTTMTISGGLITLEMQNQDTTTGFAISGGIVTLNGNWTNDDMGAPSDLTGGTLIINGDYEYGGPFYLASRFYGINVAGGTLIVNGTMRVNSPSTTATYSLDASPIQFSSGKVIVNGGKLISNVPQATPIRTVSANNSVTSIGSGVAGAGYTTGTKSTSGGTGTGLTLSVTNANGITNTTIVNRGSGFTIGDVITVLGGSSLATFVVTAVLEFKVYSAGMNTNLVQNGGTLAGKKKKIRVNIVAVINTQIQLNDNLGSGNIIFTANATTFPSLSQLAQALVTSINANAIQITASQDIPGTDTYFYLESDSTDLGFTSSGGVNIGEIGLVPGMYPITPKVLGTIIEDVDVE